MKQHENSVLGKLVFVPMIMDGQDCGDSFLNYDNYLLVATSCIDCGCNVGGANWGGYSEG